MANTSFDPETGRREQLKSYASSPVLAGIQWAASMSLLTPSSALKRHGEVFRGDPNEAPMYGIAAEGIWVPIVDWGRLGLEPPEPGEMWSVIGNIPTDGGDFLPFLMRFREIVESDDEVDAKLTRIRKLCDSSSTARGIARKIARSKTRGQSIGGPDFAKKFFAQSLQDIPGIGAGVAMRLFDAGFRTVESVVKASDSELLSVHGLGPSLVKRIRDFSDR